jgi:hypothetical protein
MVPRVLLLRVLLRLMLLLRLLLLLLLLRPRHPRSAMQRHLPVLLQRLLPMVLHVLLRLLLLLLLRPRHPRSAMQRHLPVLLQRLLPMVLHVLLRLLLLLQLLLLLRLLLLLHVLLVCLLQAVGACWLRLRLDQLRLVLSGAALRHTVLGGLRAAALWRHLPLQRLLNVWLVPRRRYGPCFRSSNPVTLRIAPTQMLLLRLALKAKFGCRP